MRSIPVNVKEKIKPTLIHVLVSLLAATAVLALLLLYWFPSPLMGLGAVQGVQLVLVIDLVIGPLCTFIVYKKGKKGLVIDFIVIGVLQVSALMYGLWAVSTQKPAFMVLSYTGLEVVSSFDEKHRILDKGKVLPNNLKSETVKYEGVIPVVFMRELEEDSLRGGERIEFEFNETLPYYFDVEKYRKIVELSTLPMIASGQFEFENGCYLIPVSSPHGSSEVCLAEKGGQLVNM